MRVSSPFRSWCAPCGPSGPSSPFRRIGRVDVTVVTEPGASTKAMFESQRRAHCAPGGNAESPVPGAEARRSRGPSPRRARASRRSFSSARPSTLQKESARLTREKEKAAGDIRRIQDKLSNASFVERAPKEVVDREREKLDGACPPDREDRRLPPHARELSARPPMSDLADRPRVPVPKVQPPFLRPSRSRWSLSTAYEDARRPGDRGARLAHASPMAGWRRSLQASERVLAALVPPGARRRNARSARRAARRLGRGDPRAASPASRIGSRPVTRRRRS